MEYQGKEIVVLMHTKHTDPVRAASDLNDQVSTLHQLVITLRNALRSLWNERTPDTYDEAGEALAIANEVFQTEKEPV